MGRDRVLGPEATATERVDESAREREREIERCGNDEAKRRRVRVLLRKGFGRTWKNRGVS